jgi:DNA-directed RNA polymerase subunit RPC12/RpoP
MIDMDKYNPDACPSCGSVNILLYDEDGASTNVWRHLGCERCGERWVEEYTLTSAWIKEYH